MELKLGAVVDRPSLEALVESGMLTLESLHPGGLELTRQLAELCNIQRGALVLDLASGTGETACFLAETFAARVYGVDRSDEMIRRGETKARARGLEVEFRKAEAANLPFDDFEFDAAICECTLCFLEKRRVLSEMVRVVRSGGWVGMHDLCWREGATEHLKRTLEELEGETPETLEGWRQRFEYAGLVEIKAIDKSELMSHWIKESRKQLGLTGQLRLVLKIIRRWGVRGAWRILRSERMFANQLLGYAIVVGAKRSDPPARILLCSQESGAAENI
jgi:ubiquinone/menaquinone biosynthesis C-methylase UbiE